MERPWIMNGNGTVDKIRDPTQSSHLRLAELIKEAHVKCPVCQYFIDCSDVPIIWPKLPIGVKFEPTDLELLQNLEEKCNLTNVVPSVLINEFIPTIEQPEGICYTHPENLPGIKTDGSSRHFFHRITNAYGCGHRKRRKIDNNERTASEVRWHKTGKSKVVYDENGSMRGWKKILVLYTGSKNGGGKTDKAGWVMHQYHLGVDEAEKDGQFVVCKIFYQLALKQIDKSEMNLSVAEHDASSVKIDPRTPKTDPHTVHGEAESSTSNFRIKDEDEQVVWYPKLSQNFEDTTQPDVKESGVTGMQTFGSGSGSGSGVLTFLDKGTSTVSSMQVVEPDASPNSQFNRSWESGAQVTLDEPTQLIEVTENNRLEEPMHDGLPNEDTLCTGAPADYNTLAGLGSGLQDSLDIDAMLESFYSSDADGF